MATELQQQAARLREKNAVVSMQANENRRFVSLFMGPKEAAGVDMETIHAAAVSGLLELRQYDVRFESYVDSLLHPSSIALQRELKTSEENKILSKQLERFLQHLSLFSNEPSMHRVLEFLIRRYRIHEHNADALISCMLTVHDSKIFARVVQLSHIGGTRWAFLEGVKKSGSPMPRFLLSKQCRKDITVLDAVCEVTTRAMNLMHKESHGNDAAVLKGVNRILSFFAATVMDFCELSAVGDVQMRQLLPTLLNGLRSTASVLISHEHPINQWRRCSCMLIVQISRKTNLAKPLLTLLTKELIQAGNNLCSSQFKLRDRSLSLASEVISTLVILSQLQELSISSSLFLSLIQENDGEDCDDGDDEIADVNTCTIPLLDVILLVQTSLDVNPLLTAIFKSSTEYILKFPISSESSQRNSKSVANQVTGIVLKLIRLNILDFEILKEYITKSLQVIPLKSLPTEGESKNQNKIFEELIDCNIQTLKCISQLQPELFDRHVRDILTSLSRSGSDDIEKGIRDFLLKIFSTASYRVKDVNGVQLLLALSHPSPEIRISALSQFASTIPNRETYEDLSDEKHRDIIGMCHSVLEDLLDSDADVAIAAWNSAVLSKIVDYIALDEFLQTIIRTWETWTSISYTFPAKGYSVLNAILLGVQSPAVANLISRNVSCLKVFKEWLIRSVVAVFYEGLNVDFERLEEKSSSDRHAFALSLKSTCYDCALCYGDSIPIFKGIRKLTSTNNSAPELLKNLLAAISKNILLNPVIVAEELAQSFSLGCNTFGNVDEDEVLKTFMLVSFTHDIIQQAFPDVTARGLTPGQIQALQYLVRFISPLLIYLIQEDNLSSRIIDKSIQVVKFLILLFQACHLFSESKADFEEANNDLEKYCNSISRHFSSSDVVVKLLCGVLGAADARFVEVVGLLLVSCFEVTTIPQVLLRLVVSNVDEASSIKIPLRSKVGALYALSSYFISLGQNNTNTDAFKPCQIMSLVAAIPILLSTSSHSSLSMRTASLSLAKTLSSLASANNKTFDISSLIDKTSSSMKALIPQEHFSFKIITSIADALVNRSNTIIMDATVAVPVISSELFNSSSSVVSRYILVGVCLFGWNSTYVSCPIFSAASAAKLSLLWPYTQYMMDLSQGANVSTVRMSSVPDEHIQKLALVLINCIAKVQDAEPAVQNEVSSSLSKIISTSNDGNNISSALVKSILTALSEGLCQSLVTSARTSLYTALVENLVSSPGKSLVIEALARMPVNLSIVTPLLSRYIADFNQQFQSVNSVASSDSESMNIVRDNGDEEDEVAEVSITGLSRAMQRITTVLEAISTSISSGISPGDCPEFSSIACLLMDLFKVVNNRGLDLVMHIDYSKIVTLDLARVCITMATDFILSASAIAAPVKAKATPAKSKKNAKVTDETANPQLAYSDARIAHDIENVLECLSSAKSDQLQSSALAILECLISLKPSSIHSSIESLGAILSREASGTIRYNSKNMFIEKVLRTLVQSMTSKHTKASQSPLLISQDILQHLCRFFHSISSDRRLELASMAVSILGETSTPALVNILLANTLKAYEVSEESEAAIRSNNSSTSTFILLSKSSQKKYHRMSMTSTPEELFRLALAISSQQSPSVQVANLILQLKCAHKLLNNALSHFSALSMSEEHLNSEVLEVGDSSEDILVCSSNGEDQMFLKTHDIYSYFDALYQKKLDGDSMLGNSSPCHGSSLALALTSLEFVAEMLENKAFHIKLVSLADSSNSQFQRLFLEAAEQILELMTLSGHIQQSSGSTKFRNVSFEVKLGGKILPLTAPSLGKTLWDRSSYILESLQKLLDAPTFVQILEELLSHEDTMIRNKALQVLSKRLQAMSATKKSRGNDETLFLDLAVKLRKSIVDLGPLLPTIVFNPRNADDLVFESPLIGHCQSTLLCIDSLARFLGHDAKWAPIMAEALAEVVDLSLAICEFTNKIEDTKSISSEEAIAEVNKTPSKKKRGAVGVSTAATPSVQANSLRSISNTYSGLCKLLGSVYLCCGTLCHVIGPRALPVLSKMVGNMISSLNFQSAQIKSESFSLAHPAEKGQGAQIENIRSLSKARLLLVRSIVSAISAVLKEVPTFSHPYINRILSSVLPLIELPISASDAEAVSSDVDVCLLMIHSKIPSRLLIPAVYETSNSQLSTNHKVARRFVQFLGDIWSSFERKVITSHISNLCTMATLTLDYRRVYGDQLVAGNEVDDTAVHGVVEFCLKLTESELKSFVVRLAEWKDVKIVSETSAEQGWRSHSRSVMYYSLIASLSSKLCALFQPCMISIWPNACESIKEFSQVCSDFGSLDIGDRMNLENGEVASGKKRRKKRKSMAGSDGTTEIDESPVPSDVEAMAKSVRELQLRSQYILRSVSTSCSHNSSSFIDETRYDSMVNVLVPMLSTSSGFASAEEFTTFCEDYVISCLSALAIAVNNDLQWKPLNRKLLMMTRNSVKVVRLVALKAVYKLFTEVGEEYLLLLPECLPFFSELLEDDSEDIVTLTTSLVRYIEDLSGESLDSYLQ